MRKPVVTTTAQGTPTPMAPGSPAGDVHNQARPPPVIPDHELLQPIGRGAYGEVWLARSVVGTLRAVKVVHRHDFGDEHPFDREFKGIQKFEPISRSHPGLVNILQIGRNEAEGYFYYVMELADDSNAECKVENAKSHQTERSKGVTEYRSDGKPATATPTPSTLHSSIRTPDSYAARTLRSDLKLRGRLPFDECLKLGLSLTSALEHLHENGLVHRDIKPSNIIFVNDQPKLADIGLVAGIDEARSFVGTEGYVPPEGPGKPQADLYSLGIVLYVMSTGNRHDAFPEPRPDLGSDPDLARWLELNAVIHKACLADPRARYQSGGEMHADLLRLQAGKSVRRQQRLARALRVGRKAAPIAALAAALLAGGVALWPRRTAPSRAATTSPQPLFVLPLRSPPGDKVSEELAGRVTDALIDSLGIILGPGQVGPRKSGWLVKSEDEVRRLAFLEHNAREVLEGKVAVVSNRMQVTLASYTTATNSPTWTESFSGTTNNIITLEWAILGGLARRVSVEIPNTARPRISQLLSNNLEALDWVRKGWEAQKSFSVPRLALAKEAFLHATELDKKYADAHFGVLWVCRVSYDRPYREAWPDLRSRARIILEDDSTHRGTRYFLGVARVVFDYDWERGIREVEAVLSESWEKPNWAIHYRTIGRLEEARRCQAEADQVGLRGAALWHSVVGKYIDHEYEQVVLGGRSIQKADPESHIGFLLEAWGHIGQRDYTAAVDTIHRGLSLHERQDLHGLLGYVYARMGETKKANEVLTHLNQLAYAQPYWVARVHAALGNTDQALTWLERAYEDRSELLVNVDIGMGGLRLDEAWDGMRAEPRFQELLRKTGLDKWPK